METQLLRDQEILPTKEVLENILGGSYLVFDELMGIITSEKYNLVVEWNYYKDGKAWLCKVCYKKKTVFWLSVWDKFFKLGFYFTEKSSPGISELGIDERIKEDFGHSKMVGKLVPLVINVNSKGQIDDIIKIAEYKKGLK